MKRLVNKDDPRNVLVVDHAYGSGLRSITCEAGNDSFDLWADQWTIEDLTVTDLKIIPAGNNFRMILECSEALMDYMAHDEDIRLTVYEQLKRALDAEVLRVFKGEGAKIVPRASTDNHSPAFALARSDFGGQNRQEK